MKRFEIIQGGKEKSVSGSVTGESAVKTSHPEIVLRYSVYRRMTALLMTAASLGGLIYWLVTVLPSSSVKPEINYAGLVLLALSFIVSTVSMLKRFGTSVVLAPESVRARIFGVFGARVSEVRYDSIASVGYAGQGDAPNILITEDSKAKTLLPGLLFKDKPVYLEVLQDRVVGARRAVADQIEFPPRFASLWQGWMAVLAMVVAGVGIIAFNVFTHRQNFIELALAGAMLSMTIALAFLGAAPFATYTVDGRVVRRKAWFRPDLARTADLREAKRYSITGGPRRKLHLFDSRGKLLMTFELSAYDFSSLTFWAARALEPLEG